MTDDTSERIPDYWTNEPLYPPVGTKVTVFALPSYKELFSGFFMGYRGDVIMVDIEGSGYRNVRHTIPASSVALAREEAP